MNQNLKTIHSNKSGYIPALRFGWATKLYDTAIYLTMREKNLRHKTVEQIVKTNPAHILEVGCGTGSLTEALARRLPDTAIVGIDIDPGALEIAESKIRNKGNVRLMITNLLNISDKNELSGLKFDHIVSSLVLHHLTRSQKQTALRNLYSQLKDDCLLTIVDWGPPTGVIQSLGFWLVRLLDGFAVTHANKYGELPSMLSEAGFVLESVKPLHQTALGTVWLYQGRQQQNRKENS